MLFSTGRSVANDIAFQMGMTFLAKMKTDSVSPSTVEDANSVAPYHQSELRTSPSSSAGQGECFPASPLEQHSLFTFQSNGISENVWIDVNRLLKAQILRNQRFAEILSPVRKREQQMLTEKKKRAVHKQNIRRKFSITNGFKSKAYESSPKSSRVSASITRWQNEISRRRHQTPSNPPQTSTDAVHLTPKIEPIH